MVPSPGSRRVDQKERDAWAGACFDLAILVILLIPWGTRIDTVLV